MLWDVQRAAVVICPPAKRKVTLRYRERKKKKIIRLRLLWAGNLPQGLLNCDFSWLRAEFARLI